jgi:hypothetical protein
MILLVRFDADFASFFKNKIIHFRKISKKLVFPEITPFHSVKTRYASDAGAPLAHSTAS